MNKRVTLLRMFEVSLKMNPFIISIHDCESGRTEQIEYEAINSDSLANQAAMYLNKKGIIISHMALSTGNSVALLTEDFNTDL